MGIPYKNTTAEEDSVILQTAINLGDLFIVEMNPFQSVSVYTKETHKEIWISEQYGEIELTIHSNIWINYPAYALKGNLTKYGREYIMNKISK